MADQLEQLKKLQALDGELFRLRKLQEEKPRELEALTAVAAAQEARVKAADARVKSLQLAQKEKEGDLQTREGNVKKLQSQLFQVKTNKEYSAMQREIETLKADNSVLEEAIIKTLEEIDAAGKDKVKEQQRLAQEQERLKQEKSRIDRELAEIGTQADKLERSREALVPDIEKASLATYEQILSIREGLAMVPLMNDNCGGCYRRLPPQVINQVLLRAALVTCESCNRILYIDEAHSKL